MRKSLVFDEEHFVYFGVPFQIQISFILERKCNYHYEIDLLSYRKHLASVI